MRKIREVLRLSLSCGLSTRAVARSCDIAHSTVREYLNRAGAAGVSWPVPEEMDDDALSLLLFPKRKSIKGIPEPAWPHVHQEMRRKGVTRRLLWLEYREQHIDGYGYSRFCERYSAWVAKANPTMRRMYKAGEWCFVDFAGMSGQYVDADTGEMREAAIFVAVLPASNYIYCEALAAQDLANWIAAHVNAFEEFGGVPAILGPDNTATAVRSPNHYEPDLNPTYREMAEHYGTAIVPARVRRPRDKAPVETAVQIVERWVLAPLRRKTFVGLAALNEAMAERLDVLNARTMRAIGRSRIDLLEDLERPALKPLPSRRYVFAERKVARVNIDYHIAYDGHFYSAPYQLVRQEVEVRATRTTLELFHRSRRAASHVRSYRRGRYTTQPEHMPPHHRFVAEWTPERFIRWGRKIGPQTGHMVEVILESRPHPQQAFRACLGLLRLADKHGPDRLEAACRRGLHFGLHTYKGVNNILDAELDRVALEETPVPKATTHRHVRGGAYYR